MSNSIKTPIESVPAAPDLGLLAEQIRHEDVQEATKDRERLGHALRKGRLLLQAKELVPSGQFMSWVKENCGSRCHRMATWHMRLARCYQDGDPRLEMVSNAGLVQAVKLGEKFKLLAKPSAEGSSETDANEFGRFVSGELGLTKATARPPLRADWTVRWLQARLHEFEANGRRSFSSAEIFCAKLEVADLDLVARIAPEFAAWLLDLTAAAREERVNRPVQETLGRDQRESVTPLRSAA